MVKEVGTRRVVVLQHGSHPILDQVASGCIERLQELMGSRLVVERRNGGGDKDLLRQQSMVIAGDQYDAIVTIATPATQSMLSVSTGRVPIVFTFVTNPAAVGYSGPGSLPNVTGLVNETGYDGTIDALVQLVPGAREIGYLVSSEPNARFIQSVFEEKLGRLGLGLRVASIESARDIPQAARALAGQVDAFLVGGDHVLVSSIDTLLDVANSFDVPVFAVDEGSVARGAVAASTIDYRLLGKRTAEYVLFVLAGAPADSLPVEHYSDFVLVINEEAAKARHLEVPQPILDRARQALP